ncbi:hemerythrin domain-containing protein [Roseitranquillus sediminis]|uniref:hemerythrin domain-containing protein n=1 Tax=Roseitranquillus sediminis TaxID=2809051 RepID=UPI001D0C19B7|nr:hemerythrin domain-containing protein [Roseitranquillus sediminis]MBM9595191.1 hemerythrin domain-containing protein [Roseitranquillus sediminis]
MIDLALETRERLPDALRELAENYPREAWESHDNFGGLVAFWLERHMMFRKLLSMMSGDVEAALDGDRDAHRFTQRLGRYGSMFVGELHGHHTIEDTHYFPVLSAREPAISRGFELLETDHEALDGYLDAFVRRANGVIAVRDRPDFRDAAGAFREELVRLERLLDRHLVDEEELVVPVILRHGERALG